MWEKHLTDFKSYILFECSLSTNTYEAYLADCTKFFDYMQENFPNITPQTTEHKHLSKFIQYLNKEAGNSEEEKILKASSQRRIISGIRAFFKYLIMKDYLDHDPCELIETKRLEQKLPVVLHHEEIQQILSQIDKSTYHGYRDSTIIETLYSCGLRISELLNLKLGDIRYEHEFIKVLGKGNKERYVPIGEHALQKIKYYIHNHRSKLEKIDIKHKDLIFLNRRGRQLTRQYVFQMLKNTAKEAGITKNIHPHTLRHSFATALIEGGANLIVVKEMLGHESIMSTQIYTQLDTIQLRETLMLYHPHYKEINKQSYNKQ